MDDWKGYFRKREKYIRRKYREICEEEDDAPVISKDSKLLPHIPYYRPLNQFKQLAYRFAVEVHGRGGLEHLIEYVKERDKHLPPYRGDAHLVDWALRLASPKPKPPQKRKSKTGPKFLRRQPQSVLGEYRISPSQISKFGVELQLAFSLNIYWRNLTIFIAAVGGYDYIRGQRLPDNLGSKLWVKGLMTPQEDRPNPAI